LQEVKDIMHKKSGASSPVDSNSACVSRALVGGRAQVLFDGRPCSALDPISTGKIEELIFQLREKFTIVIVTHNMQQASRVAEFTGFFPVGKLIEFDKTEKSSPIRTDKRTEDYITGRFGINQYAQPISPRTRRTKSTRYSAMGGLAEQALTAPASLHRPRPEALPHGAGSETQIQSRGTRD